MYVVNDRAVDERAGAADGTDRRVCFTTGAGTAAGGGSGGGGGSKRMNCFSTGE